MSNKSRKLIAISLAVLLIGLFSTVAMAGADSFAPVTELVQSEVPGFSFEDFPIVANNEFGFARANSFHLTGPALVNSDNVFVALTDLHLINVVEEYQFLSETVIERMMFQEFITQMSVEETNAMTPIHEDPGVVPLLVLVDKASGFNVENQSFGVPTLNGPGLLLIDSNENLQKENLQKENLENLQNLQSLQRALATANSTANIRGSPSVYQFVGYRPNEISDIYEYGLNIKKVNFIAYVRIIR